MSWWELRNDSNVLFLFFEDMKDDLENVVKKVAAFIGIEDKERISKTVEMSSFEFMKQNETKFAEKRLPRYRNKACGVTFTDAAFPSKVVMGSTSKGRELMGDDGKKIIKNKWLEVVAKPTGFQTYSELRSAFKKERMSNN